MQRQGKYTRKPSRLRKSSSAAKRRWNWFRRLSRTKKAMVIALPIFAVLILVPLITYLVLARDIADPDRLMNRDNTGVELLDKSGAVFYSTGNSKPLNRLKLSEMSDWTTKAVISSEDKDFYKHSGVSVKGLVAALYANVANRDATAYGGSTLTQQLVKNKLLNNNKTFLRKYQEIAMAIAVDRRYSKDEILDMYLNSVYFGEGAFGVDEAAKVYFNKSARDLTLAESSMLIGLLPAPSIYSPVSGDAAKAKSQQERVLRRMVEDKKITEEQKKGALAEVLSYAPTRDTKPTVAPHYVQMVIAELNKKYGEEAVKRSGYQVTTTLDLAWQKDAEAIVTAQTVMNARGGGRNASLVAIDPKSGEIRALVGSSNFSDPTFGQVNMAITPRQPGSSYKPVYTAEAFDKRIVTPATVFEDKAMDFNGYKPENYDFKYRGKINVRNAIGQSLNIPMVQVMQKLGVDDAVSASKRMGITSLKDSSKYGLSLALGSAEVSPVEMTNVYAALADAGEQFETTTLQSIKSKYGETIYTHNAKPKRVISAAASYLITDVIADQKAKIPSFGTSLNIPGRTVAVKTGSTNDNRDAWTIGYTPSLAVGVWVGNNENEPMSSGGGGMAAPIWKKSMVAFLGDTPNQSFARPSGVVEASVCKSSGFRASGNASDAYKEVFISGTVPTESCGGTTQETAPADETPSQSTEQQPTRDSDNDGVPDDKDLCPNTPGDTKVTTSGCPQPTETPPATTDTDTDGVIDTLDRCPNTPSGVAVDSTGCPVTNNPPTPGTNGAVPIPLRVGMVSRILYG